MVIDERLICSARAAVEGLYDGVCDVVEYGEVFNKGSGITRMKEAVVYENVPCRLSFERGQTVRQTEGGAQVGQQGKLFIAPEINIKSGSKIIVKQCGRAAEYGFSGTAAVYPTHQEILVSPFGKWA